MRADDPLQAFFQAEETEQAIPAVDRVFKAELMSRIAARRFRVELLVRLVIGFALAIAIGTSLPVLSTAILQSPAEIGMVAISLVASGIVAFLGHAWISRGGQAARFNLF
ncbi:MAG: hypothetical protein GYB36_09890 [Alphaproteobacteria bacterium]|nr:hypothetical protein [Alphaproteobacteria bacterium]